MTSKGLPTLKQLFLEALRMPESKREPLFDRCPDQETRLALRRMLAARQHLPRVLLADSLAEMLTISNSDSDAPEVGTFVDGRYRLDRKLALTGTSLVYEAIDTKLSANRVVVKILRHADGDSVVRVLRNEVEALARLQHPGVAGLIDGGVDATGRPFVVTKFIPGRSLREHLVLGSLNQKQLRQVIYRVADILHAAHVAGVIHRDVKPENIIVDARDDHELHVSVIDFGISAIHDQDGAFTGGTPAYMAPEQLLGQPVQQSDIFALAKIAVEILGEVPDRCDRTIQRGLKEDPRDRPATPKEFALELDRGFRFSSRRIVVFALVGCFAICCLILMAKGPEQATSTLTLRALTYLKGVELEPVFSPDETFLYFSHGPGRHDTRKLFQLKIATGKQRQITNGAGSDRRPAVSRDGRWLAFIRDRGAQSAELHLMPSDGGASRIIWSGNLQSVSFGASSSIVYLTEWVHPRDYGIVRRIDLSDNSTEIYSPPEGMRGDIDVTVAPNGRSLAFIRYRLLENADLYVVALDRDGRFSGAPRRITTLDRRMFWPAWYPDSKTLVLFAGTLTKCSLWTVDLRGIAPKVTERPAFGDHLESASISLRGSLAVVRNHEDSDIWQFPLDPSGGRLDGAPSRVFPSSTSLDEEAQFAPDGKKVAFFSERSGSLQAWVTDSLLDTPRALSSFLRAEKAWLAWSPNGMLSIFARIPGSGPELYQLAPGENDLRRVFQTTPQSRVVGIANDGMSVYVTPEDRAIPRLERWWLHSDKRELIARVEAGFVRESEDSQWVYFAKRHEAEGLFRMARGGGPIEHLVASLSRRNSFSVTSSWLYYTSPSPAHALYARSLTDGKVRELTRLERIPGWGMDVSPDGRSLLLSLYDLDDADIFLSDHVP